MFSIKNKISVKAVSPLISVVLIILVSVIIFGLILSWSKSYSQDTLASLNSNVRVASQLECNDLKFVFDNLKIDRINKNISFLISNNSSIDVTNLVISLQAFTYNGDVTKLVGAYKGQIEAGESIKISTDSNNFIFTKQDFLLFDLDPYNIELLTITTPTCPNRNYDLSDITVYDPLENNIIANWSFNQKDSDGNTIYDLSDNEYNGVSYNTPKFVVDYKGDINSALFFNGVDDLVDFGRPEKIEMLEESRTISFWLLAFPGSVDTSQIFYANASGSGKGYGANIRYDADRFRSEVHGSVGGRQVSYKYGLSIFDQIWKHYTVVYDANGFFVKLYVNSNLVHTSEFQDWGVVNYSDYRNVVIGAHGAYSVGAWPLFASLSDFKVYNKALNQDEIDAIYNEKKNLLYNSLPIIDGLVGYWSLSQKHSSGNTIYDLSGRNNNGISSNTPVFVADQKGDVNAAISFNGDDDYLLLEDFIEFNRTEDWSISMWQYKPEGTANQWEGFIGYNLYDGGYWMLHPRLTYYLDHYDDGTGSSSYGWFNYDSSNLKLGDNINFGEWFYLSIVYDSSNETIYAYKNGVLETSKILDWSPRPLEDFKIKYIGMGSNQYFTGYLSDILIYNKALTQSEIETLYNFSKE